MKRSKISFNLFHEQATKGDTEAQNYLGIHYSLGLSVERDYKKAHEWYKKAAKAGNPYAQRNVLINPQRFHLHSLLYALSHRLLYQYHSGVGNQQLH